MPLLTARSEVRKAETRLEKLQQMYAKLQDKLADPALYTDARRADRITWQKKFTEVETAIERAEGLWLKAQDTLDQMEGT